MSGVQVFSQTFKHFCCNFKYLMVLVKKKRKEKKRRFRNQEKCKRRLHRSWTIKFSVTPSAHVDSNIHWLSCRSTSNRRALLQFRTFYSLLLSHAPEGLRAQPTCSTSPSLLASLPALFVYRKRLHGYLFTSDLSHSSYLFFSQVHHVYSSTVSPVTDRSKRALSQTKKSSKTFNFKH